MSRIQETPRQDEIAKYLSEHPLSSAKDVRQGLGGASSTIGVRLLKMYEAGVVTREQDEEHVYRYVLKDATFAQEVVKSSEDGTTGDGWGDPECAPRVGMYASLLLNRHQCVEKIIETLKRHPNSTEEQIRDISHLHEIVVGGILLYLYNLNRVDRTESEDGTVRYSYSEPPKRIVKVKTLDDFTPREMFEHLKKLGFKWKPESIYFEEIKRTYVEFDKI